MFIDAVESVAIVFLYGIVALVLFWDFLIAVLTPLFRVLPFFFVLFYITEQSRIKGFACIIAFFVGYGFVYNLRL